MRNRVRGGSSIANQLGLTSTRGAVRGREGCGRSRRIRSRRIRSRISRAGSRWRWVGRVGSWRGSIKRDTIRLFRVRGTGRRGIISRGGISHGGWAASGRGVCSRSLIGHVGVTRRGGIVLGRRVGRVLVLGNNGDGLYGGLGGHGGSVSAATDAGDKGEDEEKNDDGSHGDYPGPAKVLLAAATSNAVESSFTVGGAGAPVDALLEMDDGALGEVRVEGGDG